MNGTTCGELLIVSQSHRWREARLRNRIRNRPCDDFEHNGVNSNEIHHGRALDRSSGTRRQSEQMHVIGQTTKNDRRKAENPDQIAEKNTSLQHRKVQFEPLT